MAVDPGRRVCKRSRGNECDPVHSVDGLSEACAAEGLSADGDGAGLLLHLVG